MIAVDKVVIRHRSHEVTHWICTHVNIDGQTDRRTDGR